MASGSLKNLYPPVAPHNSGHLDVGDGHEIYFEECGNPDGKPVVFLHGGPGAGSEAASRRFFDPARYRIVMFDQRGCGRSRPFASLENNTTWDLVSDIEKLREHLGVERWQVFGGSWGSTLALVYAQAHPERVTELVLRGIFLLRDSEIQWFYQAGASQLFPDHWQSFLAPIPEAERGDMISAYYRQLSSDDREAALPAARAWSMWEGVTSSLHMPEATAGRFGADDMALPLARIECHYFVNQGFLNEETAILNNIDKIRHIPCVIVQGRYDVVCPAVSAWDLHQAWPEADLRIAANSGHTAFEPDTIHELVTATDRFAS